MVGNDVGGEKLGLKSGLANPSSIRELELVEQGDGEEKLHCKGRRVCSVWSAAARCVDSDGSCWSACNSGWYRDRSSMALVMVDVQGVVSLPC